MTKLNKILIGVALTALLATGCSQDTPQSLPLDYTLNGAEYFQDFAAIGNSLTAGFMDGGLVMNGQVNSYPQLLASAMGFTQETWMQPLIAFPGVGSTNTGDPSLVAGVLRFDGAGISLAGTTPLADVQSTLLLAALWPVPYNNLGVPGATTYDVAHALNSATSQSPGNAYFDFVLRNSVFPDLAMVEQAIVLGPKIVTVWIGNNDILGGAMSGTPVVGGNITPTASFAAMYTALLDQLIDGIEARHGYTPLVVVGNIPSIANAPYFVPKALFDMLAGGAIPTVEADPVFVRFPALSYLGGGGALPLPAEYTLTAAEVDVVNTAVTEFNAAIADEVAARDDVVLYDANAVLAGLDPMTEGAHFIALVGGGLDVATAAATTYFSLDGIHPNNRGYALVANGMIDAINAALDTELPQFPLAAFTWDPTYGIPLKSASDGPLLSPAAAAAMDAVFR